MLKQILFVASLFTSVALYSQIPPGYYNSAMGFSGNDLKNALHTIIDDHNEYSYDDLRDFILKNTDEDPNNSNNVILLYTGRSQAKSTFGGNANEWNREHVWAKSHGDFGNNPPCGTDAHHIRPTDVSVNSDRGNKDFDNGGQEHSEALGNYYTSSTWEPRDAVKGDVARMIFYMAVRYEGGNGEPDLEVVDNVNTSPAPEHGRLSTLLEWHQQDPPDEFEINRNNVIYSYQNNRNPYIDHPEFLIQIYDPSNAIHENKVNQLIVYPNPAVNFFSIQCQNIQLDNSEVIISNLLGRPVYKCIYHENDKIDLIGWSDGLYILTLVKDNHTFSQKLQIIR
jgi:endonuclease I